MLTAVATLTTLGLCLGSLLVIASRRLKVQGGELEAELERLLPGTQCGQCGYPGCTGAAIALAKGEADITLCPPGGRALAASLADKMGVVADLASMKEKPPSVAFINEDLCVGCTRCFKRCPTDAIVGANKQIHAVIADSCTGCEKCVEACPTECLTIRPIPVTLQSWHWPKPGREAA